MTVADDSARAMARIRRGLESLLAEAERPRRDGARTGGPLAEYDWRGLWARVGGRIEKDGRGWRVVAAEIGVTSPDLSRIKAGQPVAVHKVLAMCAWADLDPWAFFRPAMGAPRRPRSASRGKARKRAATPAGRATPGDPSGASPDGDCFTGKALKQRARKRARKVSQ